jgi:eukaryotic-like serine/threonine-protein kinase
MSHGTPMTGEQGTGAERILGRYALFDEIAAGGMATVHLGRMLGPVGFSKTVAIKRLHPNLARDPEFVSMFLDEARLAARIHHPNVVATLDVVAAEGEVFLVLDYVQGESLSHLLKATRIKGVSVHPRVVASIMVNALHGLHAAHEAVDEHGGPLGIVHRDVSPQNILVGVDGVARVLDFGVAKAAGRLQNTRDGQLKGKLAYMAPEQIKGEEIDRRTDVYAASVVLWEALVGRRLVHGLNEGQVLGAVLAGNFPPPSSVVPSVPPAVDALVMRGISMNPAARWQTAREFAIAVERTLGVASPYEVAEWAQSVGAEALAMRAARVREMESTSAVRVSMHDGSIAEVIHDRPPRYDASRSGVTHPPRPPAPAPVEGTGSVFVHPNLAVPEQSQVSQPSAPGLGPPPLPVPAQAPYAAMQTAPPAWGTAPPATRPAPASQTKMALIGVAVALAVGLVALSALFVWRSRSNAVSAEGAPRSTASVVVPPAESRAAPPSEPAAVEIPPVAIDSATPNEPAPTATPAPTPKPTVAAAPKSTVAGTAPKSTGHAAANKPPKGCEVPFSVDENGIKHIKPECM